MGAEDKRTAVNITTNLSGQLIAAALAMLAIEGGVVSFVYGQRETEEWFIYLIIVAAAAFVISIFLAGKGITELRDSGLDGTWDISKGKNYFNWQAILCLAGLCCFFASAFLIGEAKDSDMESRVVSLDSSIAKLEMIIERHGEKLITLSAEVKNNDIEIAKLKNPDNQIQPTQ